VRTLYDGVSQVQLRHPIYESFSCGAWFVTYQKAPVNDTKSCIFWNDWIGRMFEGVAGPQICECHRTQRGLTIVLYRFLV